MRLDVILVCAFAAAASVALTGLVRRFAVQHGVLDVPNARSSHVRVTPRGGGLAIVAISTVALCVLGFLGAVEGRLLVSLIGGGLAVGTVGFLDDRRPVRAGVRLAVHAAAGIWALAWLGGLPPLRIGGWLLHLGLGGDVVALLAIIWVLNLFNFMDGIDGIAASEAVFVTGGAAMLGLSGTETGSTAAANCAFAAACCGFLVWNWPPARIFMGDVGSGYLGYVIAVLALATAGDSPAAVWVWLILGGVFFVDATLTLTRRLGRGERVYEAHRSHAYQWLARRWRSHKRVTLTVLAVNVLWLLPWAALAGLHPERAFGYALAALAPLVLVAAGAGAGRKE